MPATQQPNTNSKLPHEKQLWFKELGYQVLAKIYEQDATPGSAQQAGSVVQAFQGVYEKTDLQDKTFASSLYHQKDRSSLIKVVKNINRFLRSDPVYVNQRQDYLTQVASIIWAAKDGAIKQGDNFERGSFKIKDPEGKLFNFLKGYVQFATGRENPGYFIGSNDFAYNRDPKHKLSSHYSSFETEQYGIDMRFTGAESTLEILPNEGDSHLLFGRVKINEEWYTFIKAEPAGLGHPLESLEHAKNLLIKQKKHNVNRKEKDIPKPLREAYEKFHLAQGGSKVKTISDMYQTIINAEVLTEKGNEAKAEFLSAVEQLNFSKDILIRTGNEVILDFHTFLAPKAIETPEPIAARTRSKRNQQQSIQVQNQAQSENLPEEPLDMKEQHASDEPKTLSQKIVFPVTFHIGTLLWQGAVLGNPHWNHITDNFILGALPIATEINGMGNHQEKIMADCVAKGHELGAVYSIVNDFEIKGENLGLTPVSAEDWKAKNINHVLVPMDDFGGKIDISVVKKHVDDMQKIIESGKSVYVHCKGGKGRSFSFTVAYLLMNTDMDVTQIFAHIIEKRTQVSPGSAQLRLIENFRAAYCPHKAPLDKNSATFQAYRKDWKTRLNRVQSGITNVLSSLVPFNFSAAEQAPNTVAAAPIVQEAPATLIVKRKSSIENEAKRQKLSNTIDLTIEVQEEEVNKRKPESQGGSSKRLKQ